MMAFSEGPLLAETLGHLYRRVWTLESHVHGFKFLLGQSLATRTPELQELSKSWFSHENEDISNETIPHT